MADLRIADAPEIALEDITGNEKIPTGGYGNSAVTITNIGQFAKTALALATEEFVGNAIGQKENKILLTAENLLPASVYADIPKLNNSVLNTVHQDLLNRMEWIKNNVAVVTNHQALTNRNAINTHPSTSISHNGTSNVSIEIEGLKNDVLEINTSTIPELKNDIIGKEDLIVNDTDLTASSTLSTVPSTNNSALNNSLQALVNRDKFINDSIRTGLPPLFDQVFSDEINGYPLNARIMLDNGDIVRSTIANNTANPNVDMTGWSIGLPSSLVTDSSGKSQQNINDNTAYFYETVNAMVADVTLVEGKIVSTRGYHNVSDDGGATYIISTNSTNYSIPLSNGLHAVFCDTFDIRKFGIRNNPTLNQSVEIGRMIAYADSRVYEIDFLGYSIMNPETYQYTTNRETVVRGMGFNYAHKIKNLRILNDKTKQLVMGTSCIVFLPKQDAKATFALENVTFDPFVADYKLNYTTTAGEYDGMMLGFFTFPHPEWVGFDRKVRTGYSFDFKNIHFESAAVSYNLATAGIQAENVSLINATGQYWGLYLFPFANNLKVKNVSGVLRNDLDLKTRILVMNMIHEESEIGASGVSSHNSVYLKDLKAVKYTDNSRATAFKHHSIGTHTIARVVADNISGHFEYYAPSSIQTTINRLEFLNCYDANFTHQLNVNIPKIVFKDSISNSVIFQTSMTHTIDAIEAFDSTIQRLSISGSGPSTNLNYLKLTNCKISDETYGLYRTPDAGMHVNRIDMIDCEVTSSRVIEGSFDNIYVDGLKLNPAGGSYGNLFFLRHKTGTSASIFARNVSSQVTAQGGSFFAMATTGQSVSLDLSFSKLVSRPALSNATLNEYCLSPSKGGSKTYDWPSLAAGAIQSTTIAVSGATVGEYYIASFNQPLLGTRIWAEVTVAGSVTVYQQNPTASPVDVASGTLSVRLI